MGKIKDREGWKNRKRMEYSFRVALLLLIASISNGAPQKRLNYVKLGFDVAERFRDPKDPMRLVKRSELLETPELFDNSGAQLRKRTAETDDVSLSNSGDVAYLMSFQMGTPAKQFRGQLDTGSSDLWLYSNINEGCNASSMQCSYYGEYDPNESQTFQDTNTNFRISYLDYTRAQGPVFEDTMVIGDNVFELPSFTFGLGTESNSSTPVFGIGLQNCESFDVEYSNFPMRLYQEGYINRVSYSLYLDSINSTSGTFLAGAVDVEKFYDDLSVCPIVNLGQNSPSAFYITSNGMQMYSNNLDGEMSSSSSFFNISTVRHPLLLDSGSTMFMVTDEIYHNIGTAVDGITEDNNIGLYGKCSIFENQYLQIDFCGDAISVPLSFLAMSIQEGNLKGFFGISNDELKGMQDDCFLMISPTPGNQIIAGDALMRYLYVYFDLDTLQVAVAKANYDPNSEDIVMVPSGVELPASATKGALYSVTYQGDLNTPSPLDGTETTLSREKSSITSTSTDSSKLDSMNNKDKTESSLSTNLATISVSHTNSSSSAAIYYHKNIGFFCYLSLFFLTILLIL